MAGDMAGMLAKLSSARVLSVIFTVAVAAYVAGYLDWAAATSALANVEWDWLALALLVFALNYVLRTLRFATLIATDRVGFRALLGVTSLYGMFNYLLPARSGELSFLVLVYRRHGISIADSGATLITARFFDFALIALVLPAVLVALRDSLPRWLIHTSWVYCAAVVIGSAVFMAGLRDSSSRIALRTDSRESRSAKLTRAWGRLLEGLRVIDRRRQHLRLALLTAAIWMCVYTCYYFIVVSIGFQPTFAQMIVVSIFMVPLTLLPVQGVANIGTHEAAWVAAFSIFGQNLEDSLTIAVTSHVVLFGFVLLLGLFGALISRRSDS